VALIDRLPTVVSVRHSLENDGRAITKLKGSGAIERLAQDRGIGAMDRSSHMLPR
jgi:hypothetical protein